jgi:glycosyltransferase involved in cell wall biosynthesis
MKVLKSLPDTRILIVSNSRPNGWEFDGKKILFRKWSAETEVSDLQDIDIGLMPLQDSEWTRGKCSFKMLQYLAVGIPAVVSPVGMNNDILKSADVGYGPGNDAEEWVEALLKLCQDEDLRAHKGIQGRKLVEKKFSVKTVAQRISITIHQEIQLRNKNIVKQ